MSCMRPGLAPSLQYTAIAPLSPNIVVIGFASWSDFVRLRRPWEERARAGWAIFIGSVERGARRAREGVRSTAYPPAHPVDGSQPRGRARRTSLNGENGSACAGLSTHSHAHACVHCPTGPAPQSPSVRGRCAQTRCNSDAAGGSRPCRVAIAPPCVSFATFLWLWMGPAVPRSVLCVRSRTGLDARANLLSRLWAFRAVLGVHVDHHSHR